MKYIILLLILLFSCTACTTYGRAHCYTSMTDNDIVTNIQTRYAADTGLSVQNIHVASFERAVVLSGAVENPTQACIAVKLAKGVPCVKCVTSRIRIKNPVDYAI
ncbi:MAG TPA: BON domain-containing protein [Gammaproteobacteria bacterium]|jgi:osmotically-inducible protein OsmY|nr:BON domain-containing protein [Gammaproteobacteria bacterium]